MHERYPYLRLLTDAGNIVAGIVSILVLLVGLGRSWHLGGMTGAVSGLVAIVFAWLVYLIVNAQIEAKRLLLEIHGDLQDLMERRSSTGVGNE